ncbi:TPA: bifunctional homocysteine S-methyltransferase/methylenetetrahydrofolate reductase [Candidatus Poribacteria bacterium]|nr:bifunctional homocysteine S-methyltransferase/methylenetetrahydrofolate reductase [Candidatus Poribacteria bacterium]HIB92375.1 bifunctional homocysteine S-methyltransferase/methylenetetrahydrofolate reductase [Candidatus Poribacteria bacterium]HIC02181.1 bifunctional homocysteine S-methyltransferase/methylenetetrahydrofolate reductase [Candidatus Poribacteria bacterium]HIO48811.1 bifunctional homocysteine S-methyltransferase/methylenetetrahydrofolate reductase [Candidatus Poribacteria bacter
MSEKSFLKELDDRILVCDGAFGTQLRKRIPSHVTCLDACNIDSDYLYIVQNIHREYKAAGADIIQTNTFGANAKKLEFHGLDEQVEEINSAGAWLAREVAAEDVFVAGSVGPIESSPFSHEFSAEEVSRAFKGQMEALVESGVDLIMLETFTDSREVEIATQLALTYDLPVVVQIRGMSRGKLSDGTDICVFARQMENLGVAAAGINDRSPHEVTEILKRLAKVVSLPIIVQPDAGAPRISQGKLLAEEYTVAAHLYGEYVSSFVKLGANIIGGCCGTTPEHIQQVKLITEGIPPAEREKQVFVFEDVPKPFKAEFHDNPIQQIFDEKDAIISVEMRAKTFTQFSAMIRESKNLAKARIDLFDVPDNAGATVNIGAIGTAFRLQQETSIPTIIHWTTRQRNLISTQSHLLEAWALGIEGILALSGDHPKVGRFETARIVTDLKGSVQLIELITRLNNNQLINGTSIGEPCNFHIGAGFNIAENLENQVKHLTQKVENGAQFVYTQPVYTLDDIERAHEATKHLGVKILYGILPITTPRSIPFLRDNLGIYIPRSIVEQFSETSDAMSTRFGLEMINNFACNLRQQNRVPIDGIYIIPPSNINWKNKRKAVIDIIEAYRGQIAAE